MAAEPHLVARPVEGAGDDAEAIGGQPLDGQVGADAAVRGEQRV